jgi:hypothetical protein
MIGASSLYFGASFENEKKNYTNFCADVTSSSLYFSVRAIIRQRLIGIISSFIISQSYSDPPPFSLSYFFNRLVLLLLL